jgi:ribosomal protein L29
MEPQTRKPPTIKLSTVLRSKLGKGLLLRMKPSLLITAARSAKVNNALHRSKQVTPEEVEAKILELLAACHEHRALMATGGRSSPELYRTVRQQVRWADEGSLGDDLVRELVLVLAIAALRDLKAFRDRNVFNQRGGRASGKIADAAILFAMDIMHYEAGT